MICLKQILVATDFSEPSDAALNYGRELARAFGAHFQILNVVGPRHSVCPIAQPNRLGSVIIVVTMPPGRRTIRKMCTRWGHTALALVLSATLGSSALADCMSGMTTPEVQMAYCKAMHHECHKTADGSSCCPKVNQAPQQFSAVKASPAPDLRSASTEWVMVPLLFAPPLLTPVRSRPETDPPRHAPPNLLTSALRI